MKFRRPLDDVLGTRARVALLRELALGPSGTSRQLADYTGLTHTSIARAALELESLGIVVRSRIGRSRVIGLVRQHFIVRDLLLPMLLKERRALQIVTRAIVKRLSDARPWSVALFGSVVRREEDWSSDLDVLAVGPDVSRLRRAAEKTESELGPSIGGRVHTLVFSPERFSREARANRPLIREILRAYRLLAGRRLEELIR